MSTETLKKLVDQKELKKAIDELELQEQKEKTALKHTRATLKNLRTFLEVEENEI
jgi:hypothetical protein